MKKHLSSDFLFFTTLAILLIGMTIGICICHVSEDYEAGTHGFGQAVLVPSALTCLICLGVLIGHFYNEGS